VSWYGVAADHQTIPRKVLEYGMFVKSLKVEVHLLGLRLGWKSDPEIAVTKHFSRGDTIGECCQQWKLNCLKKIGICSELCS